MVVEHSLFGDKTCGALAGDIGSAGLRLIAVDEMVNDFSVSVMNRTCRLCGENREKTGLAQLVIIILWTQYNGIMSGSCESNSNETENHENFISMMRLLLLLLLMCLCVCVSIFRVYRFEIGGENERKIIK